jgi:hypothetical protein
MLKTWRESLGTRAFFARRRAFLRPTLSCSNATSFCAGRSSAAPSGLTPFRGSIQARRGPRRGARAPGPRAPPCAPRRAWIDPLDAVSPEGAAERVATGFFCRPCGPEFYFLLIPGRRAARWPRATLFRACGAGGKERAWFGQRTVRTIKERRKARQERRRRVKKVARCKCEAQRSTPRLDRSSKCGEPRRGGREGGDGVFLSALRA